MIRRWPLAQAARLLHQGAVIAYPTEAVYGLGCDPMQELAVLHILELKHRHPAKGLILIASCWEQLEAYVQPPTKAQWQRLQATWPGPVTWLIPARTQTPHWLTGSHDTLAVRVTDHPVAAALCDQFGGALVSTSANPGGLPPARSLLRSRLYFADQVDIYLGGNVDVQAQPSRIMDLRTGKRIR